MKQLRIYYTSDNHGFLLPVDYATGKSADTGLANCISNYEIDGNTLVIDGGDSLQGSPLTFYLANNTDETGKNMVGEVVARVMNIGGYRYVTLGNHDFNFGVDCLNDFISALDAEVICANVEGLRNVKKSTVVTLENGLKVGITGVVTHFVNVWEKPHNIKGITITEPIPAAKAELERFKAEGVDVTICIYHGGFENDLETGALLLETAENQAYRICRERDFDILLTGHQHLPIENRCFFGTYTCQTPDKAKKYIDMTVTVDEEGSVSANSVLKAAGDKPCNKAVEAIADIERAAEQWLDVPVGHLDVELVPEGWPKMAEKGSLIANFFNQVQLAASGADISDTSLANEVKGFERNVTIRDVVATYVYPNTLITLEVDRHVLKTAMERCAEYFDFDGEGNVKVSDVFLKPKVEHYNYDFFYGIEATYDLRRPVGDRVVSIIYDGEELAEDRKLKLCMNNYRASGTGGYEVFKTCPVLATGQQEISEIIMDYIAKNRNIAVDKRKWLKVIH